MDRNTLNDLFNKKNAMKNLKDMHQSFLAHMRGAPEPTDIGATKVVKDDGTLVVHAFDTEASATPRLVQAASGAFVVEYVFVAKDGEDEHEVWRFYLMRSGLLAGSPDSADAFGAYTDQLSMLLICSYVAQGLLASPLLNPRPPRTA